MVVRLLSVIVCTTLATSPAFAQDDLLEKIKHLEQQIQELKTLKVQQNMTEEKSEQCMKVMAREKICTCIGNNLPRVVNFEGYVHTLVTTKGALGYSGMNQEQKNIIDATLDVRDKCIEKGFFK